MKQYSVTELDELKQFAQSMGMSPEEYAISLHKKNKARKSLLLDNVSDFKAFITEFHKILDDITIYKETDAKNSTCEHYTLMKHVSDLISTASKDPMLLAQLYQHYPEGLLRSSEKEIH